MLYVPLEIPYNVQQLFNSFQPDLGQATLYYRSDCFQNASVISHFIRRVDMVYMLSKALSCNLEVLLYS